MYTYICITHIHTHIYVYVHKYTYNIYDIIHVYILCAYISLMYICVPINICVPTCIRTTNPTRHALFCSKHYRRDIVEI